MEYQLVMKSPFQNTSAFLQSARPGAGSFGWTGSGWWAASFSPYNFRPPLLAPPAGMAMRRVYDGLEFTLYFLSSKGGNDFDYYRVNNRTLAYDRRINWSYWLADELTVTAAQLKAICPPATDADISKHITYLNDTMKKYEINTRLRQVHFLSQLAHESQHFSRTLERASGQAYEGRVRNLGNTEKGDGPRFKGRGLIQLTGRDAYTKYGSYIGHNITTGDNMKLVEQEPYASDCAGWFWLKYKSYAHLNAKADRDDFIGVTRGINGGLNGVDERRLFYNNAKKTFSV